jgi:hypothetical protein
MLCQHAQQATLSLQRHLVDLIKKQRPALRRLHQATEGICRSRICCAIGKNAFKRRRMTHNKWPTGSQAHRVQLPSHQLLPRPLLSTYEYGAEVGPNPSHLQAQALHRSAASHNLDLIPLR